MIIVANVLISVGGETFDDMHDERAPLWSNVSLFMTILEFFLPLVGVSELTF